MTVAGADLRINFSKKAHVTLADTEEVSLWDDASAGTLNVDGGDLRLAGIWRVSAIGNFLGSGLLGYILIRPFFQKRREERVPVAHVERVIVRSPKRGKAVYHVFQSRDGGVSEVHVFTAGAGTEESALEGVLASLVGDGRFKKA